NGREPWSTDGTPAGTRRLADICPGACDGALSGLAPIPGGAAFLARELPFGSTAPTLLWRTDGTAAGTRLLANPGLDASILGGDIYLAKPLVAGAPGGRIYFSASNAYGQELWTSDGTARGTRLITDLARKDAGASPNHLTAISDRLFFTACSEGFGLEVWQTAGSPESTQAVTNFGSGCYSSGGPAGLTAAGGLVFFSKVDYETNEVWRSDGTAAGLQRVALLTDPQKLASLLVPLGDKIFFLVGDDTDGRREVWKSDGTAAGTGKAFDLPGLTSILRVFGTGQELFLTGITAGGDPELWISDGTAAGSRKLLAGSQADSFHTFVRVGAAVFFGAWSGSENDIWMTDGTAAGTRRVAALGPAYRSAWDLTAHGGALYFFTEDGNDAPTLWRATAAGATQVRTFAAREWLGRETYLTSFNGLLYFVADGGTGSGGEVWKSDGTPAGTGLLRDIAPGRNDSRPRSLTVAGGRLFFTANDGVHGAELWQTDGTVTRLVQDIAPEGLSSSPSQLTVAGGRLYFVADDGLTGPELWALPLGAGAAECRPSPHGLCLGGRYQVEVAWKDFQGRRGAGTAVPLTADTGYFWFFDPANVEVIVKVLDGQGLNGHRWVFYGALSSVEYTLTVTDVQTGLTRRYFNPSGTFASVGDTQAFGRLGAFSTAPAATSAAAPPLVEERTEPAAAGTCQAGPQRLCLNGNRFAVEVSWKDFQGRTGNGRAVALSGDTGYFWFFNASNVELVTKVLDGTALNGKHWFFYGALSNVEYRITVTDTVTGKVKTYTNPAGRFASVGDTGAF
ncbi:MAG TPA: ELWxxDGT repeat protein, partial [Thermoanaerobaculia bacterium]|nr:ELWxxDGT repeat protein [Thermoanaerobaculia bacterium]